MAIEPPSDRAGLLADILGEMARRGLDNAKIHSAPTTNRLQFCVSPEMQMFYVEIKSHQDCINFQLCKERIEELINPGIAGVECFRVLGSYRCCRFGEERKVSEWPENEMSM